jgi:peptidyl-prolyl cis-trans isomerase SurA
MKKFIWLMMFGCSEAQLTTESAKQPESTPVAVPADFTNPTFAAPVDARYSASHILVSFKEAEAAPAGMTRTETEARTLAEKVHVKAVRDGDFSALAANHSDDPSRHRGGQLGVYYVGTMVPIFEAAVASVDVREITPLIKTPFGYHIVRRDPIVEVQVTHILISHRQAPRSQNQRTKDQANTLAWEVYAKAKGKGTIAQLARTYSDEFSAKTTGGNLGTIAPGQMVPQFDQEAFALQVGQVSEPVETIYGFHIIQRTR